ncbi:MAG: hypothetical protein QM758_11145 [Armatimonas sp.]
MEPLRQRFLTYLDERDALPEHHPSGPVAVGILVLSVATALFLAVSFPYHQLLAAPLIPLGVLWLFQGVLRLWQTRDSKQRKAEMRRVVTLGDPVAAYVVKADERLERPGSETRSCLALITFEADAARDSEWLQHLAHNAASQLPRRQRFLRYRRQRLPDSRTDGYAVYLVDLEVHPSYLESGFLNGDPLPCLAEPGESGGIELIPHWLIFPIGDNARNSHRSQTV